jgi:hypothetical protein
MAVGEVDKLIGYLESDLWRDAQAKLKRMAEFPRAETLMKVWDPRRPNETRWWYEGPIRGVVADYIARWVDRNANENELLVLAEQRFPDFPVRIRADVAIRTKDDRWVFVEIKADFDLSSALEDAGKLQEAASQLGQRYRWGLILYVVNNDRDTIDRWNRELSRILKQVGVPRPLIRGL